MDDEDRPELDFLVTEVRTSRERPSRTPPVCAGAARKTPLPVTGSIAVVNICSLIARAPYSIEPGLRFGGGVRCFAPA